MTGMADLGAADPQSSKGGQAVSSVEVARSLDGAPMVLIPASPFTMGSNDGLPNERPEHTVMLDSYYIDQYEVTLGLYRNFLELGKKDSPATWDSEAAVVGDRPAMGIRWESAAAYCQLSGRRRHRGSMGDGIRGEICSRSIWQTIIEACEAVTPLHWWQ
jgi:sulfatase modifying factor 1